MEKEQVWEPYPEDLQMLPEGRLDVQVARPSGRQVVMGAAGKAEKEVYLEAMKVDQVPLFKRKGGGGTVLLGPQTLVVTIHAGVTHTFRNLGYFQAINNALIEVFSTWKKLDYHQRGISDIAVGEHKIVGSSIYRSKHYLLYQASILVALDLEGIQRFLRHPPREPDYRKGRAHGAFLTSLRDAGVTTNIDEMAEDLRRELPLLLPRHLRVVNEGPSK